MNDVSKTLAILALTASLASWSALSPALMAAGETPQPTAAAPDSASTIRITNFGRVSDTYFRGSQPDRDGFARLATLGVKTVIDLQEDGLATEPALVEEAGMKFFRIPMNTRRPPTNDERALFLKLVNDPANQPVYVHCAGGRHRTGVMTALYRMTVDGWAGDRAFKEMKQYDYGPDFLHPEFKKFVYAFKPTPAPVAPVDKANAAEEVAAIAN